MQLWEYMNIGLTTAMAICMIRYTALRLPAYIPPGGIPLFFNRQVVFLYVQKLTCLTIARFQGQ